MMKYLITPPRHQKSRTGWQRAHELFWHSYSCQDLSLHCHFSIYLGISQLKHGECVWAHLHGLSPAAGGEVFCWHSASFSVLEWQQKLKQQKRTPPQIHISMHQDTRTWEFWQSLAQDKPNNSQLPTGTKSGQKDPFAFERMKEMRLQLHFYVLMRISALCTSSLFRKAVTLELQQLPWMNDDSASPSLLLEDISCSSLSFFPAHKKIWRISHFPACAYLPLLILLFLHGVVPGNLSYKSTYLRSPGKNKQDPVLHQNQKLSGWVCQAHFSFLTWAVTGAQAPDLIMKVVVKKLFPWN